MQDSHDFHDKSCLYYNNSYYLLNPNGDKVKPLSPVNDPKLLQKLKEYTK